ncbi:MAG: Sir2 family NAD-dependent protein deacetylase [Candidatus Heimdallarchaeota archaeon]|nr:Sir2 family NAD-dependent protein deacetylase [Candidatus Heimdallarchaeota archaeon]MCK5143426.1 Sir2 family NAD-dependent protein deacetylase [Candidatus Heimdallarchaeota archaeon]
MKKIPFTEKDVNDIVKMINESNYVVVFTGAGISTESGLADFRGEDGIWTRKEKGLPPKKGKHFDEVKPNEGHLALVALQDMGVLKFLISQNVDNLHLKSGIKPELIAELHGNYMYMKCIECDTRYKREEIGWEREIHGRGFRTEKQLDNQPVCPKCNGRIISSVINFNDPMPEKEMMISKKHTQKCDLMLVVGSSLSVFPAAGLPRKAQKNGVKLIIINIDSTPLDEKTDIKLEVSAGEILSKVVAKLKEN